MDFSRAVLLTRNVPTVNAGNAPTASTTPTKRVSKRANAVDSEIRVTPSRKTGMADNAPDGMCYIPIMSVIAGRPEWGTGKVYLLALPANAPMPTGKIGIRNAKSGIDLGTWEILPDDKGSRQIWILA